MKKISAVLIIIILNACNHHAENKNSLANDGKEAAHEICDCYKKANEVKNEPARTNAQNDCIKKESEVRAKFQVKNKISDEFNKALDSCTNDMLNKRLQ